MSCQGTEEKVFENVENKNDSSEEIIISIKKTIRNLTKHIGVILSSLAIIFIILIYVYQMGYLNVYNIPYKYISINLQNHIPILYIFISYSVCGVSAIIDCLRRKSYGYKNSWNFKRISVFYLLLFNAIYNFVTISFFAISWIVLGVTVFLEIVAVCYEKGCWKLKRKKRTYTDAYGIINKKITRFVLFDSGFVVVALLLPFMYKIGDYTAKTHTVYEIFYRDNSCYVIIADYNDMGVVQQANVKDENLVIDASHYKLLSKEGIEIEYKEFESVSVKND